MDKEKASTKVLLKSGFWYTVSSYLTKAMVFITMPIFTRLMSKGQYGDFSVFANWQAIFLIVCGLENYSTINRARFDFEGEEKFNGYISSSLLISTGFTGLVFIVYLAFPNLFNRLFLLDQKYILMMFAYLFTYPAFAMFQAKQRIEYKYKLSAGISLSASVLSSALAVGLVVLMPSDRLMGRILGQYLIYILIGLAFFFYFLYKSRRITVEAWKYALRMGLPMVFGFLSGQALLSSDSFVVKQMCTAEQVSYISVTHSCSHIILLLVQTLNGAWAPWFFDMLKADNIKTIRKTYQYFLWFIVVCTFGAIMIGPEIILVLGGKGYMESLSLLPIYILGGVFTVLTAQFSNLEAYYKKPEYSAIFTMVAAALNIALDIIGVRYFGYRAVCYATLICQLILIALHYCFTVKMGIRKLLPLKSMLIPLAASLLMIPCGLLLYQNNIVRYIVIAVVIIAVGIVLVLKREEITVIIKRFRKTA